MWRVIRNATRLQTNFLVTLTSKNKLVKLQLYSYSFTNSRSQGHTVARLKFPDDFLLGAASSSYQVEGAWNEDGNHHFSNFTTL